MMQVALSDIEKARCIRRELALRRAVYPSMVAKKRMAQVEADREIAVMEAILEDYMVRLNGSH